MTPSELFSSLYLLLSWLFSSIKNSHLLRYSCFSLSFSLTHSLTKQILWTFSIYLEAVAILPQLFLLQRTGEVENLTSDYIFCLGAYRALYILNWIYRYFTEEGYTQWIVWIAGVIQTAIYCDFFYYYVKR